MIREAKEYMAQFPAPKHAFQYIEDRKKSEFPSNDYRYSAVGDVGYYTQFKENQKITKAITAELAGRKVSIQNGDEAVAFELREKMKMENYFIFLPSRLSRFLHLY